MVTAHTHMRSRPRRKEEKARKAILVGNLPHRWGGWGWNDKSGVPQHCKTSCRKRPGC